MPTYKNPLWPEKLHKSLLEDQRLDHQDLTVLRWRMRHLVGPEGRANFELDLPESHLPVRRTLEKLGLLPGSFYRWVERYQTGGVEALEDKPSKPSRVWNRIPDDVRRRIVGMALDEPELSLQCGAKTRAGHPCQRKGLGRGGR